VRSHLAEAQEAAGLGNGSSSSDDGITAALHERDENLIRRRGGPQEWEGKANWQKVGGPRLSQEWERKAAR